MDSKDLKFIQDQIGYFFKNEDLLQQAFVRRSYSKENGGENNEVLEFIGDKALDFIVVKMLTERYGYYTSDCDNFDKEKDFDEFVSEYQENKLTEIKKKLVEKTTLASCMDNLGLAEYLIMGKGDRKNNVQNEASVKEDLFEAILGAVALDSDWNISALHDSIELMLNPDEFLDEEEINYVSEIRDWALKQCGRTPMYHFENVSRGYPVAWAMRNMVYSQKERDDNYSCEMQVVGITNHFLAYGHSKSDARKRVSELAYDYLDEHGMLFTIRDEIENPSHDLAINQLETLARRGYFSIPTYNFIEEVDKDGNPIWRCECHIKEKDVFYWAKSTSKKEAKKDAAFSMLKFVLESEEK